MTTNNPNSSTPSGSGEPGEGSGGDSPEQESTQSKTPVASSKFVFVACQPRSQQWCKSEIATTCPGLTASFSRRGFITWKTAENLAKRFDLPLSFARTYGWSLEELRNADTPQVVQKTIDHVKSFDKAVSIHVWNRDWTDHPAAINHEAVANVKDVCGEISKSLPGSVINAVARPDQAVVDVIRLDDGHWWFGWHLAGSIVQRWPGGIPVLKIPEKMISRAYLKASEALLWSGVNITHKDVCVEIGSAPGGTCQKLLELGAKVIAVDPADMDESIASHKRLTHLKMRGREVPHREVASASWLFADSIVNPKQTLDTVEALVAGKQSRFRGMFLTLNLSDENLMAQVESYVERVRGWGYRFVKTRQLAYGRQEICLMALKQKAVRRFRG